MTMSYAFSQIVTLILFSDTIFTFCHCCMSRGKFKSFEVPKHQLMRKEPIPSGSLKNRFGYIDTKSSLAQMVADLQDADELAVDSEFHSIRSFQGVTCTLQISTRTKDYIIDTIALKKELKVLNKILSNPKVVKVLHDASNDVLWLEKDLNLYMVNMFDTYLAAKALNTTQKGYAFLVQYFLNVDIEKNRKYQAYYDWRIRPICKPALAYARKDTHFLLWLYDVMRNALIDKAHGSTKLLEEVYKNGTLLCQEKFKETTAEDCYQDMIRKREKLKQRPLDNRQLYALKSLCKWRDSTARNLDESVGYVMPGRILRPLVEKLPEKMNDILDYCKPGPIPVLVKDNLRHLFHLIRTARLQPLNEPDAITSTIYYTRSPTIKASGSSTTRTGYRQKEGREMNTRPSARTRRWSSHSHSRQVRYGS